MRSAAGVESTDQLTVDGSCSLEFLLSFFELSAQGGDLLFHPDSGERRCSAALVADPGAELDVPLLLILAG
ncbi:MULTISPECIES: hypothetical protein [Streptomyces]|uniref:hypothetical protein n=1 Tax=Streptomyces TaxID=1883 RepID=UPI00292CAC7C|nr:hypothetical protein [Streptomyces sp. NEAU-HV9]